MILGHTVPAVREAEAPLLAAGEPLMLRAARALAGHVGARCGAAPGSAPQRLLVLAGAGSNGGDGLHAAAMLRREGITADALATAERLHEEGAAALRDAGGTLHHLAELPSDRLEQLLEATDLVLDAILGIGGRPEAAPEIRELLRAVRRRAVPVIAVDLPSFVDATTGEADADALAAEETLTFGAVKAGLLLPGGTELAGRVHLVDLGLGPHLPAVAAVERLEDEDVRALLPRARRSDSKYTRGVVALAAGSERFPGAAVLTASGAARAGAGMVRVIAPAAVLDLVLRERPEIVGHRTGENADGGGDLDLSAIGRTDALVIGPGLPGDDPRIGAGIDLLRRSTDGTGRGVLDAGALDALTGSDRFGPDVVLTPHRGEAERLARRLDLDPDLPGPALAPALAEATGATVLLKGAVTLIAPGNGGSLRAQDDATPQLATAGTGDVLAGMLGTLLAAGLTGPDAAALAAVLHGRAGRLASQDGLHPLVALDVAAHVPAAIGTILAGAQT